jgi:hypothetical protein
MKRVILTALSIGLMPVLGYGQSFPPVNAAEGTWMMHHGSTSLSGLQLLRGAVTGYDIKCSGSIMGGESDPLIADINGDGMNEIVLVSWNGGSSGDPITEPVRAFRGTDCSLIWSTAVGDAVTGAVGELNPAIPGLEIAVFTAQGTLYALRGTDGGILWSVSGIASWVNMSPPTIFDADRDGIGEVYVVGGSSIQARRGTDGSLIWSYSASKCATDFAAVAIGDINNDGQYELASVVNVGGVCKLVVLRATDGAFMWSYNVGSAGNPVIADLDGDGFSEIVVATTGGNVYALRYDATFYWSTAIASTSAGRINSPTVADINGDGVKEVIVGTINASFTGSVYALRGTDGSTIWTYTGTSSGFQIGSRKIADIDSDGEIEIIIAGAGYSINPRFVVLRGTNGSVKWSATNVGLEGSAIGDVDNDGCMEVVLGPYWGASTFIVLDSPTPVSDCGVLGYDDPVKVEEDRNIGGVYLLVSPVKGGVNVETGRKAFVEIYTPDGRKVKGLEVDRSAFVELNKGTYIFRVKGHNLYRTVIVR